MKKKSILPLSIALNVLFTISVGYLACNEPKDLRKVVNIQNSTLGSSCYDCTKDGFCGLTGTEFISGVARYTKTHWDKINKDPYMMQAGPKKSSMEDARSCWYSTDTLKKFICLIEKYSAIFHIPQNELGIRFYYATYSDDASHYHNYINHHTLFMVPTFWNSLDNANVDMDPAYNFLIQGGGVNTPKTNPLMNIVSANAAAQFLILGGGCKDYSQESDIMAKNQGQLCPPTCTTIATEAGMAGRNRVGLPTTSILDYIDRHYSFGTGSGWQGEPQFQ